MADPRDPRPEASPEIPDLDLSSAQSARPPSVAPAPHIPANDDDDDLFELERGGQLATLPSTPSGRPASPSRLPGPVPHVRSGLEVQYRRIDPDRLLPAGPSTGQRALAVGAVGVAAAITAAFAAKLLHARGGHVLTALVPGAFDATSTALSGTVALFAFLAAMALGYRGAKGHPRSYALIGAGALMLVTALAMITVALVSTDEHPGPPDGALVVPWLVPLAMLLVAAKAAAEAVRSFLRGGARRAVAVGSGVLVGILAFGAVELCALAARLP